nr:replicative DNA helicase [Schwartzia sp. (in: firmicutes)]
HRVVFEAIMAVFQNDSAVDMITVTEQLKKSDLLDKAGGVAGVTALANAVPTAANVVYHAKIVREKAELRELINAGSEITGWAFEDSDDVDAVMDKAEKRILEVTARENSAEFTSMKDIVISVFKQIEERSTNKGGLTGVASGFTDLDRLTSGFQPSDLILVAARPSMGKTAFTLNIASYVAVHLDKPVAFFSLEMSKEQLAQRMLCSEGGIDSQRLRNGDMKDEDWEHVIAAADRLTYAPVFIDDTPGITVMELRSKARRIKAEHGLSMVIIDYLQLMSGKGSKNGDNRQQEISEISRSLKALARELKVPVIALSQLSRSVESRQVKRPMLSDLRESGSLEQDADIVMFLYREDYYDKETEQQNVTEVIVAKHRNGPIDTVRLYFDKEFTRFANFAGNIPDQ